MKKIILPLFMLLLLCSCSAKEDSFTPKADFNYDSVIKVGDFSYKADVRYKNGVVYVTPKTTYAKGMTISCDGKYVVFSRKSYNWSVSTEKVTRYNPAYVIQSILSSLDSNPVEFDENTYVFSGNSAIGTYTLYADKKGDFLTLEINDANFSVDFTD